MQVAKKRIHIRIVEGFCSLNICKNKIILFKVSEKSFEATKKSYVQSRWKKLQRFHDAPTSAVVSFFFHPVGR